MNNQGSVFQPELKSLDQYDKQELVRGIEQAIERMDAFEKKYFDLVWYARKDESMREGTSGPEMSRVEKEYPDDVEELAGENGCWHHGFNSGCLAAVRLLSYYVDIHRTTELWRLASQQSLEAEEIDQIKYDCAPFDETDVIATAEEEFPDLDT